jgi:iron complex outermembrane receptor protein
MLAFAIASALSAGLMRPAIAQQSRSNDPFSGVEEMVVRGTEAPEPFEQRQTSTIAFDTEYLEAIGANDLADIAQFTPNLEIRTPFAASNPTLFIRGVGLRDFGANSSSSVAVYVDEVYMNSPAGQLAQLFDVSDVAVLRGPQGTMYARNASAGTIRVITRKPSGTPGAKLDVTYGRFNEVSVEGAIESVLIPDMVSIRSSGRMNRRDGTTKNRCASTSYFDFPIIPVGGRVNPTFASEVYDACFNRRLRGSLDAPPPRRQIRGPWSELTRAPVKKWVNDTDNWAARTIIRITPDFRDMEWLVNFHGGKNRGDSRQFQVIGASQNSRQTKPDLLLPNDSDGYADPDLVGALGDVFGGDPYAGDYNNVSKEKLDLFGVNAVGSVDLGDFELTSVTAYEWNKRQVVVNLDGGPYVGIEPDYSSDARQVSQELRLDWDAGNGLTMQLAGMYLYESLDVSNKFIVTNAVPAVLQQYSFFTRYGSVWASARWEPAERFSIDGGIRLNHEDKEINIESAAFNQFNGRFISFVRAPATGGSAARETGLAGDVTLTYRPTEDVSFYLRYARGWKGPHINGGVVDPRGTNRSGKNLVSPVKPEKVDSVELGLESSLWDRRIRWNWAVFYYDYQDIQTFQLAYNQQGSPTRELLNADDADVLGFEMELGIKPFEGLFDHPILEGFWIHTTFAWLDSSYTDFVNIQVSVFDDILTTVTEEDFTGERLVNSPDLSFIGFIAWPIPTSWGVFVPRFDWSFKDQVFFSPANRDFLGQDPLWLLNLRLTYKAPNGKFDISGWVKNLTDQAYIVDSFNLARARDAIIYAIGDPRTYGVTLHLRF